MLDPAAPRLLDVRRTVRYYAAGGEAAPEVWVVLHGYGQLAAYFLRPFRSLAGAGRRFLAPEAPSRFYLDDTYTRIGASWMTRESRETEIRDAVAYLDALVRREVGPNRGRVTLCGLGFSQGASALARWAALGSARLDRLVLWGGEVPADLDLAAHGARLANLTLVAGDTDALVTPERIGAVETRLREGGVPFTTVRYPGGHRIEADVLRSVVEGGVEEDRGRSVQA